METVKDIIVTDLKAAIWQCLDCSNNPYKMESGHTVGEHHRFMLKQLEQLQEKEQHVG